MSLFYSHVVLSVSGFVFFLIWLMLVHTLVWCCKKCRRGEKISKPILTTALLSLSFFIFYTVNWGAIIAWDLYFPVSKYICIYESCNDAIYIIGKGFMFLFFFTRLYDIYANSILKVNKISVILLGFLSLTFSIGITTDIMIDILSKFLFDDSNDLNISKLTDCGPYSNIFGNVPLNRAYLDLSVVFIVVELLVSAIVLRLLVGVLLQLYINQKKERIHAKQRARSSSHNKKSIPNSNRVKFISDAPKNKNVEFLML